MIELIVTEMQAQDWEAVSDILRQGIAPGNATFETDVPEWDAWDSAHLRECRLVAREGGQVVGWAALSPVSSRCIYAGVAEVSVYVTRSAWGRGVGKALLQELIVRSEQAGIWTLQAGVFPENQASLALHASCGFREVGYRERIGQLAGVWRDTVLLERRSKLVGVDNEQES